MIGWPTKLFLTLVLTTLEVILYNVLDLVDVRFGTIAAVCLTAVALLTFHVLASLYVARAFARKRSLHGMTVAAVVWTLQIPVLFTIICVAEGPPVLADDSLWNVGIFGWWYTGIVSIPLIGLFAGSIGWVLDRVDPQRSQHGASMASSGDLTAR